MPRLHAGKTTWRECSRAATAHTPICPCRHFDFGAQTHTLICLSKVQCLFVCSDRHCHGNTQKWNSGKVKRQPVQQSCEGLVFSARAKRELHHASVAVGDIRLPPRTPSLSHPPVELLLVVPLAQHKWRTLAGQEASFVRGGICCGGSFPQKWEQGTDSIPVSYTDGVLNIDGAEAGRTGREIDRMGRNHFPQGSAWLLLGIWESKYLLNCSNCIIKKNWNISYILVHTFV